MSAFKPLILADDPIRNAGQPIVQQLQGSSDLDIPLEERFQRLQRDFATLVLFMAGEGFDLPIQLTSRMEEEHYD